MCRIALTQNSNTTTESLIEQFLTETDIRESSKATYRRQFRQFIEWCEKTETINPTRETILQYRQHLIDNSLSCSTVTAYVLALKHLYAWLEDNGLSHNYAKGIRNLRQPVGFRKNALTVEQAKRLLAYFDRSTIHGLRDYAIVNLMIRSGIRVVEVVRLSIGDIRENAGSTVMMIQGKGMDGKEMGILTDETLQPIQEYLELRGELSDTDPLFASISDRNDGGRLSTRSVSRLVLEALRKIGIVESEAASHNSITAHSLRHTAVTLCLLAGGSIQEAQMLARHRNIQTTMIYAHNLDRIKNAPERRIDAILGKAA